jgi:hypothetical protein
MNAKETLEKRKNDNFPVPKKRKIKLGTHIKKKDLISDFNTLNDDNLSNYKELTSDNPEPSWFQRRLPADANDEDYYKSSAQLDAEQAIIEKRQKEAYRKEVESNPQLLYNDPLKENNL